MAILTPLPKNMEPVIRSQLAEALQLSYNDIIPSILTLRVTQANTTDQVFDVYRMPGDFAFVISEIRGHLAINNLGGETTAGTGMLNVGGVRNRVIAKALNAQIQLTNPDRDDLRYVERDLTNTVNNVVINYLSLAMLLPIAGGSPIKLIKDRDVQPLIVPPNERLKLTFQQAVALGADDQQTEYGLDFVGALVRARG
jgi:hypothetical protein